MLQILKSKEITNKEKQEMHENDNRSVNKERRKKIS